MMVAPGVGKRVVPRSWNMPARRADDCVEVFRDGGSYDYVVRARAFEARVHNVVRLQALSDARS